MAHAQVEEFNRELRAWVKNVTGASIGKAPGFTKSTLYRATSGSKLLPLADLRALVAACAPKDLSEAERRRWIESQDRRWMDRWEEVEASAREEKKPVLETAHTDAGGEDGPNTPVAAPNIGLHAAASRLTARLLEADSAIRASAHHETLSREVLARLGELEGVLDHAIHGRIVRPGTDVRDLLTHTRACRSEIQATTTVTTASLQSGQSWWQTHYGLAYLEENKRAVARGVEIRRVFILDTYDDATHRFIRDQAELGVTASWVLASSLTPALRTNVLVWDGTTGWRAVMTTTGEVSENILYTSDGDVGQLLEIFYGCIDQAAEVDA